MSLSDFVHNQTTRAILDEIIDWNGLTTLDNNLKPVVVSTSSNPALIGTAFDYLFRFKLQANHLKIAKTFQWAATLSLKLLKEELKYNKAIESVVDQVAGLIKKAKEHYYHYIISRKLERELLESCIHLAQIESYYRRGELPHSLGQCNTNDIAELQQLHDSVPDSLFTPYRCLWLNPHFGKASELVGGADADVILDASLIDLKTSKYFEIKREYIYQLVGYLILNTLSYKLPITSLSIYFARFTQLVSIPVDHILDYKSLPNTAQKFLAFARSIY